MKRCISSASAALADQFLIFASCWCRCTFSWGFALLHSSNARLISHRHLAKGLPTIVVVAFDCFYFTVIYIKMKNTLVLTNTPRS